MDPDTRAVTTNRKAFHQYHILDSFEAGLVLTGTEVKSLREGRVNLRDAHVTLREGEAFLVGMHIGPYSHTGFEGHDPYRDRKVLLHRREIRKLAREVTTKGRTLVPLKVYFKDGWAKVEVALAKGKRQYEKKRALAERDRQRILERDLKNRKQAK
ncbi:MAG: SsrA-binding protein SmpB [Fidelibacterota bacterium]